MSVKFNKTITVDDRSGTVMEPSDMESVCSDTRMPRDFVPEEPDTVIDLSEVKERVEDAVERAEDEMGFGRVCVRK